MKGNKPALGGHRPQPSGGFTGGYWVGGILCFIAILCLSFGVAPLIKAARNKPVVLQLPGKQTLDLIMPGGYIALAMGAGPEAQQRMYDLQYALTDESGKNEIELVKIPPRSYASEQGETQVPLFQFIVDKAGKYNLVSGYPFDIDGPKITAVLFHTDINYIRVELFVGIGLFLVLGVIGLVFIYKTYKASSPA